MARKYKEIVSKSIGVNFIIRGLNMIAKFGLTIFLAEFMSSEKLGEYTIFLTTVTLSIYFLGYEFYTFAQREYNYTNKDVFVIQLRDQMVLYVGIYLVLFPILFLVVSNFINSHFYFLFSLIALEHINQELYRVLVAMGKPIHATSNNFFRSGVWVFIYILVVLYDHKFANLEHLYLFWILGELFCLFFSIFSLKSLSWTTTLKSKINFKWLWKGIKISTIFFGSGIALKFLEYSERFYIKSLLGNSEVGVYFYFYNIAYLPYTFFVTVIIINFLPELIQTYNENKMQYLVVRGRLINTTKLYSLVSYLGTIIVFFIVVRFLISDSSYISNKEIFWFQLVASFITLMSEILYLELYLRHKDKLILVSFLLALCVQIASNYILIPIMALYGAGLSKILVATILISTRFVLIKKYSSE